MDCARCGRKFFLHSPINALWCDHDQFFICRRCAVSVGRHAPMRCPQCNNRVSSMVPTALVIGVMLVAFSLLLGPVFYLDATSRQALADTPQARISDLVNGETVMIDGSIATSAHSPTFSAHWVSTGKSGYWAWTEYPFVLYQGSTSISVNVGGIGDSVYGAPVESNAGEWYYPGDEIAVIGTVYGSNGSWTMDASSAAPGPWGFADPAAQGISEAAVGVGVVGGVLLAVGWVIGIRRYRVHAARERKPGMYDYRPLGNEPPGALPP